MYVLILVVVLLVIWIICVYNKLVKLRNNLKDQWSQVDVQLKKRFDLIPNIVESVKGYAKHEKTVLKEVIEARNSAMQVSDVSSEINANNELTKSLNKLFALSEAYPELKSDSSFLNLQNSLTEVEEKISYSRSFYNDAVLKYKNAIETFPTVIIAGLLGFKAEQFFNIDDSQKENIKVSFE